VCPPLTALSCCCSPGESATAACCTLSLHDALPISGHVGDRRLDHGVPGRPAHRCDGLPSHPPRHRHALDVAACHRLDRGLAALRSEEHTSELQSRENLVCRLLREKKKKTCGARPSD